MTCTGQVLSELALVQQRASPRSFDWGGGQIRTSKTAYLQILVSPHPSDFGHLIFKMLENENQSFWGWRHPLIYRLGNASSLLSTPMRSGIIYFVEDIDVSLDNYVG